jgi:transposase
MTTKQSGKVIRYSISFKQMVVEEIEQGANQSMVRRKYGITGSATISTWIRKLGKDHLLNKVVRIETMNEKDKFKQMQQDNLRLKLALADAYMAKDCLEAVIDMANKQYATDLKKNFGNQSPTSSKGDTK